MSDYRGTLTFTHTHTHTHTQHTHTHTHTLCLGHHSVKHFLSNLAKCFILLKKLSKPLLHGDFCLFLALLENNRDLLPLRT